MSELDELVDDSPMIQERPRAELKSTRAVCAGITTSLLVHSVVLSACFYVVRQSIQLADVRSGHVSFEMRLSIPAETSALPVPIEFVSRFDEESSSSGLLSPQREVTLPKSLAASAALIQPESPPRQTSDVDSIRLNRRKMDSTDVRPTHALDVTRRPRKRIYRLPAPAITPSIQELGTKSWVPEPLASNVPPSYPADAIKKRVEGTARLRVTVSKDGDVTQVEISRSSGWPSLDQAAIDAVTKWRFRKHSSPFSSANQTVVIPIEFTLTR